MIQSITMAKKSQVNSVRLDGAAYRNVIVNGLRPSKEVNKSIEGGQLATKDLFAFNITREIHAFNIVDRDDTASSTSAAQPPVGTCFAYKTLTPCCNISTCGFASL